MGTFLVMEVRAVRAKTAEAALETARATAGAKVFVQIAESLAGFTHPAHLAEAHDLLGKVGEKTDG